ncbi:MAG: tetratricopeptide repeat protein, partial [Treponemataceae bacterium]
QEAVERFPLDTFVLVAYADLALDLTIDIENDIFENALQKTRLRTIKMTHFDSRPKILLSDPLSRLLRAHDETNDEQLVVEIYKFTAAMENIGIANIRQSDIWQELEKHPYNEYLVHYFVWVLMTQFEFESASNIFFSYFYNKYGLTDFSAEVLNQISSWEKEFFAYFSARKVPSSEYENYYLSFLLLQDLKERSVLSDIGLLNLALIYETDDNYEMALKICTEVAAKQISSKLKSEAQYRIARIYFAQKDLSKATLSLHYSLELDGSNNKARLLLKQITEN